MHHTIKQQQPLRPLHVAQENNTNKEPPPHEPYNIEGCLVTLYLYVDMNLWKNIILTQQDM